MNKTSIKNYAIWARNELISRVTQKAFEYGVEKDNIVSSNANDINGRLLSNDEKKKRQIFIKEVNKKGFAQVMEEVAYTWFNRFIALRFMEVNNYLPKKVRVFTNDNNEFKPQIMDEALHVNLLGLDKNKVITLKEENNYEELYKELLLAICNDMSQYLPGMFKPIDDYMTLLFPNNLLREESVLGRLISDIDEDSWNDQVQIIGWLYQYYNTELKDKVYARKKGTKIKKEEIPAVTQLFTPDWIVRYMTENSLGRFWLDGHPDTDIKSNWKYYLDEAEQEESVQIELNKIREEHAKYRPEDIKFLDPCMGSGHILVYAFDVFMQIYVSEGWTQREAAKSILKNNIYGLDIDERAYQLSYFALMMKARQYNRRILNSNIVPNIMDIQESNNINRNSLALFGDLQDLATKVADAFIDAKEYGSILNISFSREQIDSLKEKLEEIKTIDYSDLLTQAESVELVRSFVPLLKQAEIMSQKYECVVTNPPYMGISNASEELRTIAKRDYPISKFDLSTIFMEKTISMCDDIGYMAMINIPVWMSKSSFEQFRYMLLDEHTFVNMLHNGRGIFGADFGTTTFVIWKTHLEKYAAVFHQLFDEMGAIDSVEQKERWFFERKGYYVRKQHIFKKIASYPIAYSTSDSLLRILDEEKPLEHFAYPRKGLTTGDNDTFVRLWYEVEATKFSMISRGSKWFPMTKGGDFRRWYGNNDYCVNWENDGYEIKNFKDGKGKLRSRPQNIKFYFKEGISWNDTTATGKIAFRYQPKGYISNASGPCVFADANLKYLFGLLNSVVSQKLLEILAPNMKFEVGQMALVPIIMQPDWKENELVDKQIMLAKEDWDSFETSWDFKKHPLLRGLKTIKKSYEAWSKECTNRFNQLKINEVEINRIFIDIYGLQGELVPDVEDKDITVRKADLQREIKSLISYAVGCMFGRYSLDVDGLAYAGGEWDRSKYNSFIPDVDNIIPICNDVFFDDDIVGRFIEFIKVAYGEDTLEDNLQFIADALGGKGTPREVLRNYFINDFFKDHCNTYQVTGSGKRPIYWQFDSGKKNGFKALIYIHRYTPDLIARMRTSYVHEQQSRYDNEISMIQNQINSVTVNSERTKLSKKLKTLKEQSEELRVYEEKIHHWADKMEPMNLDDGVKKNYAKFQELLTKIK